MADEALDRGDRLGRDAVERDVGEPDEGVTGAQDEGEAEGEEGRGLQLDVLDLFDGDGGDELPERVAPLAELALLAFAVAAEVDQLADEGIARLLALDPVVEVPEIVGQRRGRGRCLGLDNR